MHTETQRSSTSRRLMLGLALFLPALGLPAASLTGCGSKPEALPSDAVAPGDAGDPTNDGDVPRDAGSARRDATPPTSDASEPIDTATGCVVLSPPKLSPTLFESNVLLEGTAGAHTLALFLARSAAPTAGSYPAPAFPLGDAGSPTWFMRLTTRTATGTFESALTAGTLELVDVASPLTVEVAARATGLELREMNHQRTALVTAGRCFVLKALDIDTRVALGTPCAEARECGHEKVCDPTTRTCTTPHCGSFAPCPGGFSCAQQMGFSASGALYACYPTCQPFTSGACDPGATCIRRALDWSGQCVRTGTAAAGGACGGLEETSTGCATEGYVCGAGVCTAACDRFATNPGCGAGLRCGNGRACGVPIGVANVPLGGTCAAAVGMNYPCGDDGLAYRGECVLDTLGGARTCRKACRPGSDDCAPGQFCGAALLGGYVCK